MRDAPSHTEAKSSRPYSGDVRTDIETASLRVRRPSFYYFGN